MMKHSILTLLVIHTTLFLQAQEKQIRLSEESLTKIVATIVNSRENFLNNYEQLNNNTQEESVPLQKNAINSATYELKTERYEQKIEQLEQLVKELQRQKSQSLQIENKDTFIEKKNIEALKNEIASLKSLIDQKSHTTTNTPIIVSSYNYPNKALEQVNATNNDLEEIEVAENENLKRMEQQLDSLSLLYSQQNEKPSENKAVDYSMDISDIKTRIDSLRKTMEDRGEATQKNIELFVKLKEYKSIIYFDNNSKEIGQPYTDILNEMVKILQNNKNVDILINGFASNKGKPIYNQNLSLQRTESVKQWFITQGVHPIRILTSYHGIDYTQTSDEKARRVEITYIIRN